MPTKTKKSDDLANTFADKALALGLDPQVGLAIFAALDGPLTSGAEIVEAATSNGLLDRNRAERLAFKVMGTQSGFTPKPAEPEAEDDDDDDSDEGAAGETTEVPEA